jgi:hypothetical protein
MRKMIEAPAPPAETDPKVKRLLAVNLKQAAIRALTPPTRPSGRRFITTRDVNLIASELPSLLLKRDLADRVLN